MHEATDEGVLAFACRHLEVDTMDVERIIHHILKVAVLYGDFPRAGYEVRGIGLGGEVASTARTQPYIKALQSEIVRVLGEEPHTFGEVNA